MHYLSESLPDSMRQELLLAVSRMKNPRLLRRLCDLPHATQVRNGEPSGYKHHVLSFYSVPSSDPNNKKKQQNQKNNKQQINNTPTNISRVPKKLHEQLHGSGCSLILQGLLFEDIRNGKLPRNSTSDEQQKYVKDNIDEFASRYFEKELEYIRDYGSSYRMTKF